MNRMRRHTTTQVDKVYQNLFLQHFIATVCVAGKMFQGIPGATIENAVESAAQNALMVLISLYFLMMS